MRKGTKVIYKGLIYTVWEKHGNAVKIYLSDHPMPEVTMIVTGLSNVKKA